MASSPEQFQVPVYVPDPSQPIYRSYTAWEKPTGGTEKIKGDPTDFHVNDAEATSPVGGGPDLLREPGPGKFQPGRPR